MGNKIINIHKKIICFKCKEKTRKKHITYKILKKKITSKINKMIKNTIIIQ